MLVTDVGDQMKCLKFDMLVTDLIYWEDHQHNAKVANMVILPSTSEISHHHKVTNITMSPTSMSPLISTKTTDISIDVSNLCQGEKFFTLRAFTSWSVYFIPFERWKCPKTSFWFPIFGFFHGKELINNNKLNIVNCIYLEFLILGIVITFDQNCLFGLPHVRLRNVFYIIEKMENQLKLDTVKVS